jgi:hypothetical protein
MPYVPLTHCHYRSIVYYLLRVCQRPACRSDGDRGLDDLRPEEYGNESVKEAFVLRGELPGYWLDWLLRSRKGHYYRKCYPSLSLA